MVFIHVCPPYMNSLVFTCLDLIYCTMFILFAVSVPFFQRAVNTYYHCNFNSCRIWRNDAPLSMGMSSATTVARVTEA